MILNKISLDNSDWTRNGDYHPDRWTAQVEAANLLAENRSERNPENGIGVISMAGKRVEVHVTLTNDLSRLLNAIKGINIAGECDFITSMNIAILTLKHRPNKSQKQRIILFVGSPIRHSAEEMAQIGKKLKKYNVAVDCITFGNVDENRDVLKVFYEAVNNSNNSSILEVPVGFYLMDSLFSSSLMTDMAGYGDFPMDEVPNVNNVVNNGNNANNQGNNVNPLSMQGGQSNQPSNINQQGGMTQFERDLNLAIQQSLDEERKKQESSNPQASNNQQELNDNVEMNEVNEEDELEQARLLSMQEHEKVVHKGNEEEDRVKDELLENQDFIKDILKGIKDTDIKEEEIEEVVKNKTDKNSDSKNEKNKDNKEDK